MEGIMRVNYRSLDGKYPQGLLTEAYPRSKFISVMGKDFVVLGLLVNANFSCDW
jgi:hypothetical protein